MAEGPPLGCPVCNAALISIDLVLISDSVAICTDLLHSKCIYSIALMVLYHPYMCPFRNPRACEDPWGGWDDVPCRGLSKGLGQPSAQGRGMLWRSPA